MARQDLCTGMNKSCSEWFTLTFTIFSACMRVTTEEWKLKGIMIKSKTDHSAYMPLQENGNNNKI